MRPARLLAATTAAGFVLTAAAALESAPSLELYGNLETMGVIVTLDSGDDPDGDVVATVSYRSGTASFVPGFPLTRTRPTQLVGSLFWLMPGTLYDVRVSFHDPDGVLHGVTLQGVGSTRPEVLIPPPLASHVVSPSGGGSSCSSANPCALAEGLNRAMPGDEVVLRGGTYFVGELSLPRSGQAGAPIVIRAATGETPILDGADPQGFTWVHRGGGVWRTTVNAADPHLVASDGERLYPYQSAAELASLAWGIPGFFADGTTLDVRLEGDANPATTTMVVTRFNHAFYVNRDFIDFVGLTFRHYGRGSWAKAVYLDGASDCLVRGCTFSMCDLGIGLKRASHRNLIEGNDFFDTIFDWPWDAVKAGSALETGGVRFYDPMSGRGTVIRDNVFHDDFDGFGVCTGSDTGTTSETDVFRNAGYQLGDDGVETDGTCSNVRLVGNAFHDVLVGVSLAPVYVGPVYAVRNLITRTGAGNSSYSGMPFKLNSGYDLSGTIYLFHNTSDAQLPDNDGFEIRSPGSWQALVARNNVWSGTRYAISNANPSQPVDLDWDCLFTTLPDELAWWQGLAERHLRTLPALQAATGQELHGLHAEPGFADPAAGDYRPGPSSPLRDAGVVLPGINHGFRGPAPDIGAFEAGGLPFADSFETGDLTRWTTWAP